MCKLVLYVAVLYRLTIQCFVSLQEKIYEVYQNVRFNPEQFNDYLLSAEVGFSSCKLLGTPLHKSKGNIHYKLKF